MDAKRAARAIAIKKTPRCACTRWGMNIKGKVARAIMPGSGTKLVPVARGELSDKNEIITKAMSPECRSTLNF
jgi:hypothetical protein